MKTILNHFSEAVGASSLTYGSLYLAIAIVVIVPAVIAYNCIKDQYRRS